MEQEPSPQSPENDPPSEASAEEVSSESSEASTEKVSSDSSEISKDARTMALLSHLLGIFTFFLVPLIIWLIKKDEDKFIDDQAKEALNFQITIMLGWFVAFILSFIAIGVILFPVLMIGNFVFGIIAALKSNEGIAYRYPFILRLIK